MRVKVTYLRNIGAATEDTGRVRTLSHVVGTLVRPGSLEPIELSRALVRGVCLAVLMDEKGPNGEPQTFKTSWLAGWVNQSGRWRLRTRNSEYGLEALD